MLPEWLDIATAEHAAAAKVRALQGRGGVWGELIASAQAVISHFEDFTPEQAPSLYEEKNAIPLIGAARILDAASQADDVPKGHRLKLATAAAVAFGMYGNSLSALATAKRIIDSQEAGAPVLARRRMAAGDGDQDAVEEAESLKASLAVALATAAPQVLGRVQPWCEDGSEQQKYLELLGEYLRAGDAGLAGPLREALVACLMAVDVPFADMLLLASRLCLEHVITLSTAAVLERYWPGCPPGYIKRLVDAGVPLLLPPQYKAVVRKNLLTAGGNALIALPTSAGKTLLGELCLVAALAERPGLVCYLAPYVALGQQVAATFRRHLPKGRYRVHTLVGGHKGDVRLDPDNYMEVVVATPERLDLLLRAAPDTVGKIRCVVCDEAHMIQNDKRGVKLEGVLARIRMQQQQGATLQVVLVSAVLPEYDGLRRWMSIGDSRVITDTWRPTARRLAVWRQDGRLTWHLGADPVRKDGARNADLLGYAHLVWPKPRLYGSDNHGAITKQEPDVFENVAYLVETVHQSYSYGGGPVLCYCSSRHSSRLLASTIASRFRDLEPLPDSVASTVSLISTKYKVLKPLAAMLRRGVAYHNASLPHEVRSHIEEAVRRQELLTVTATTTLAEGVDLPFRFTILADWLTWDGAQKQRPIGALLFRNIAGRCGRAGVMTEGDTIIFDNPVGDPAHTDPYRRGGTQIELYVNPMSGSLPSAIGSAIVGTDEYEACLAELSSQFLAAVPENPGEDDLVTAFADRLYSAMEPSVTARVRNHLQATRSSVLDRSREALATAASPLRLTPFGKAALGTSFSPESCRAVLAHLREQEPDTTPAGLGHHLLISLGTLPENYYAKFRKILGGRKNNQFPVRIDDLPTVIRMWLAGDPVDAMFLSLPVLQRSTKKPKIGVWAAGIEVPTKWDDDFEKFCDVVKDVLKGYVPWLMFACKQLSGVAGGWSERVPWDTCSEYFELGVDSVWAARLLRADAPVERRAAAIVGRRMPEAWMSEFDPLGLKGLKGKDGRKEQFDALVESCIDEAGGGEAEVELASLREVVLQRAGIGLS